MLFETYFEKINKVQVKLLMNENMDQIPVSSEDEYMGEKVDGAGAC